MEKGGGEGKGRVLGQGYLREMLVIRRRRRGGSAPTLLVHVGVLLEEELDHGFALGDAGRDHEG